MIKQKKQKERKKKKRGGFFGRTPMSRFFLEQHPKDFTELDRNDTVKLPIDVEKNKVVFQDPMLRAVAAEVEFRVPEHVPWPGEETASYAETSTPYKYTHYTKILALSDYISASQNLLSGPVRYLVSGPMRTWLVQQAMRRVSETNVQKRLYRIDCQFVLRDPKFFRDYVACAVEYMKVVQGQLAAATAPSAAIVVLVVENVPESIKHVSDLTTSYPRGVSVVFTSTKYIASGSFSSLSTDREKEIECPKDYLGEYIQAKYGVKGGDTYFGTPSKYASGKTTDTKTMHVWLKIADLVIQRARQEPIAKSECWSAVDSKKIKEVLTNTVSNKWIPIGSPIWL